MPNNCGQPTNCNCENDPCGCKTSTDEIVYTGPTLPCTLIENCTTVTEAITVINNYLCSQDYANEVIDTIINNPVLLEQLTLIVNNLITCETIWQCETTTSTTTCSCIAVEIAVRQVDIDLSVDGSVNVDVEKDCGTTNAKTYNFNTEGLETVCVLNVSGINTQYINTNSGPVQTLDQPLETTNCCTPCFEYDIQAQSIGALWVGVDCTTNEFIGGAIGFPGSFYTDCIKGGSLILVKAAIKETNPC